MNLIKKDPIIKAINSKLTKTEKRIQTCFTFYAIHGTFCGIWGLFVLIPFIQSLPNNTPPLGLFQYPLLVALILGFPITIGLISWENKLKKQWKSEQPNLGDVKHD